MAALQAWGLRKRPVTRWGFSGEQFHPKLRRRVSRCWNWAKD